MGGMGSTFKDMFTNNGSQLGDSGYKVGDMKDLGYSTSQIGEMSKEPGWGMQASTEGKLGKGMMGGFSGAMQGLQKQQTPQGGGTNFAPPQTPQLGQAAYGQGAPVQLAPSLKNPWFYGGGQ